MSKVKKRNLIGLKEEDPISVEINEEIRDWKELRKAKKSKKTPKNHYWTNRSLTMSL